MRHFRGRSKGYPRIAGLPGQGIKANFFGGDEAGVARLWDDCNSERVVRHQDPLAKAVYIGGSKWHIGERERTRNHEVSRETA